MSLQKLGESLIEEYLSGYEWAVKDNANVPRTISGLMSHLLGTALYDEALKMLDINAIRLHEDGWIYIYKLRDGSIVKPYCGGIDSRLIIEKGLRTPTIISRPPKHMDSAVDQITNAVYIFSQERTGAVGLYGADLTLTPFIRRDRLDYRSVKQNIQRFVYNLNYPLKAGQSPFSNIIFAFSNKYYRNMPIAIGERKYRFVLDTYDGYIDEAKMIIKAFAEVFSEGDAIGQPFTFPIPTSIVNGEFEKILSEDPDVWHTYWEMVAKSGQMYFLNGFRHSAEDLFSFCCRLLSDMARVREILHQAKGVWDMPPSVGSVNVVVINAPRLAMLARVSDDKRMYDQLDYLLEESRKILMWFRARYMKLFMDGMYPMTREYIDPVDPFKFYYNTIGVIGLAEYASIMLGEPFLWQKATPSMIPAIEKLYRDLLSYINSRLREFEDEDSVLYNVEEVPGETLGVKLAWKDISFAKQLTRNEDLSVYIPVGEVDGRKVPFYTNQLSPPYTTLHLRYQLDIEADCQKLFTGGVIKHIFIDSEIDPEVISKFVLRTLREKDIVYMSITPTISVCPNCGRRVIGRTARCPSCGTSMDMWSRIVGYYRPVKSWNSGRVAEFYVRRDLSRELEELAR
ncbi:anaerobic ribonucleoside-triphosphate reductase [Ignisphaera aggregans DSM 17230]|uniref:Anaerobic ribonucleoside-triphosphate reductase n=1 Tax=Ignisphaera aggregans (strain DSM 17230 / JCM 13409 / AQ1.S1) TaxID=583356 RepID=E0SQR3_IGNAA|nr:anaerobic ribonucleoside-triphosphate reductase [Ignisphaera aggregans DSM 17230]